MPRRSGSAPRTRTTLPARRPPSVPAHPPASQPRQPGLMGQMAATAGGVAVGHVVGSALTGALSGRTGESGDAQNGVPSNQSEQNPCQFQIDQLIRCTQSQSDISFCSGFSDALKECTRMYGLSSGQT
ncbi:Coiled-coil-helix-coiled-coil-helix domain-containing protein 2 [Paragonimus heterotremus]|uniref:Coiled-coil-helix-coiled-coil-helix domain-containing protein 2 n=1 Tax=Paragonimus heterotremus TaxID=100268 RepID=A0A8J4THT9_9TREM|nr:Coiled-coil-helix-coiled-coil-helix domain-containing protein 2 [Paragonimus heterotremus]